MSEPLKISPPLSDEVLRSLRAGTRVLVTGDLIAARDQAHLRMLALLKKGERLPFEPAGAVVYYVGPSPGSTGRAVGGSAALPQTTRAVGAAGPTTSARMDPLCEPLFAAGVKATIGKGPRSAEAKAAMKRHGAVYLAATGGAGALLGSRVERMEVLAWPELGPEALARMTVRDFPVVVAIDPEGRDLFERR